jgi:hypothetical protein
MPAQREGVTLPNFVVMGKKLGTNFVIGTRKLVFFYIDFAKKLTNFRKINEVIQQKLRSCSIFFNFLKFYNHFPMTNTRRFLKVFQLGFVFLYNEGT